MTVTICSTMLDSGGRSARGDAHHTWANIPRYTHPFVIALGRRRNSPRKAFAGKDLALRTFSFWRLLAAVCFRSDCAAP